MKEREGERVKGDEKIEIRQENGKDKRERVRERDWNGP